MKKIIIFFLVLIIFSQIALSETDSDRDGIADSEDQFPDDYDNDGMPDSWEKRNGLRFDYTDAKFDYDNDGLQNIEEFNAKTDPFSYDSDGDGISDKAELDANTDPLDPNSPSKFNFIHIALFVFVLIVISVFIYLIIKFTKRKPKAETKTQSQTKQTEKIVPAKKETAIIPTKMSEERKSVLSKFEENKPGQIITETTTPKLASKFEEMKRKGFEKEHAAELSRLIKDSESTHKESIFTRLPKLSKEKK